MFKIRLEIEEYSRMQKNLEADYNSTYDGKARLEISEEKQLVAAKLKRLRMELHNLICEPFWRIMLDRLIFCCAICLIV